MAQLGCVWITGASTGIGRALALRYAAAGDIVLASARSTDGLASLVSAAAGQPGSVIPLPLDITDRAAVQEALSAAEPRHGPIRTAILNAGTHEPVTPDTFAAATFERLLRINVLGTVNCIEALLPRFSRRGGGQIAIVSSVAGYRGLKTASAYGASKAALIIMAEALHVDFAPLGIDVRLINPGFVRTPLTDQNQFPMPFLVTAELAAERIWQGLERGHGFEITFPRRFTYMLKLARILPYRLYFALTRRITG